MNKTLRIINIYNNRYYCITNDYNLPILNQQSQDYFKRPVRTNNFPGQNVIQIHHQTLFL